MQEIQLMGRRYRYGLQTMFWEGVFGFSPSRFYANLYPLADACMLEFQHPAHIVQDGSMGLAILIL